MSHSKKQSGLNFRIRISVSCTYSLKFASAFLVCFNTSLVLSCIVLQFFKLLRLVFLYYVHFRNQAPVSMYVSISGDRGIVL